MGQQSGIDIFGANCLGVADSWNRVRIGGALGGDDPAESLIKGSVAIYSNSGNFTTTIAQYLAAAGWGTTTLVSSGKDVYIHFAAPEFVFALANDRRSKAAVIYAEPGGYYEDDLNFTKPVVACVVGRWKARLTRAVGHAGAMGGAGDDALAKERWFMQSFGVESLFTPEDPVCSARGAVVTNIAHIPARAHPRDATKPHRARLRAAGQPRAQAVVRCKPGAQAAARARPSSSRSRGAVRPAHRAAQPPDRPRVFRASRCGTPRAPR